ncbi:MAG: phytoene/squalene synthase family protein [Actinomycetota bacterium]|nr:phytoene/squalene synthase family protein [Actinomycetota bacterium]MDQ2958799.1 phytoene/squalene synthase family protein [Actinomycetota bacterium]
MNGFQTAQLDAAYRYCRELNAQHGKTFYLATGLLPAPARRHVHALYGFARYADDLVDHPGDGPPAERLAELGRDLERGLAGGRAGHPVVRAVVHTVAEFDIPHSYFSDFLDSMAADLTVARYAGFEQLRGYMWGSASVIGLQLLPILGLSGDRAAAERCAADLGIAFQLTNFVRDIGEDYRRGRIYLPQDGLTEHGVIESMFGARVTAPELKDLLAAEIARARTYYRRAEPGIGLLAPTARDCVRTAFVLYGEILDEIERAGYEVLARRARVSLPRRLRVGAGGYLRAVRARRH